MEEFIRYGTLSTTGISIKGWLCFKDNEGNALNGNTCGRKGTVTYELHHNIKYKWGNE